MSPETARRLKQAARRSGEWTAQRDDLIRQARAEGASLREIGELAGMTHTGVRRVIERSSQRP